MTETLAHVYSSKSTYGELSNEKVKGIWFIVLYPPKRSHNLPPLAGMYTRKPFQSPGGYSRATGSITEILAHALSTAIFMLGTHFAAG